MRRKYLWAALFMFSLGVSGLVYAGVQTNTDTQSDKAEFICPVTGGELYCSKCCPLN